VITEAELRRLAARWGVDPMVADLDYGLGWFLAAMYAVQQPGGILWFKGGTCLRKCYLADYRFSEDLDFTATDYLSPDVMMARIERAQRWTSDQDGPDFAAVPPRLEVIEDEYGSESFQARVYYRGPLRWGGPPRAIRLDVTRAELMAWPGVQRPLNHPYSDVHAIGDVRPGCYTLREILAEKLRAVCGQRQFAIARDVYDIHQLVQSGATPADVVSGLSAKCAARGVAISAVTVDQLQKRHTQFEEDWRRRLSYLVRDISAVSFDTAWQTVIETVALVQIALSKQDSSAP